MSHDVFISYSSKDKITADMVCAVLECHGIRCWIAPRDVMPGSPWGAAIITAINEARVMVLILSGAANTSPQIEREVERVISKGRPVIPFRIENVQPSNSLEYFISASRWLDAFSGSVEVHIETLAGVVRYILDHEPGRTGVPADAPIDPHAAWPIDKSTEPDGSSSQQAARAALDIRPPLPEHPSHEPVPLPPTKREELQPRNPMLMTLGVVLLLIGASIVYLFLAPPPKTPRAVGSLFSDCVNCPEMVVVPAGHFMMGASEPEKGVYEDEQRAEAPVHQVSINAPFAVGRYMVTRDQFDVFVSETHRDMNGGCYFWDGKDIFDSARSFRDPKLTSPQAGDHPVLCVNWKDAKAYTDWLSAKTGASYRLLSDTEREYVTRAGTATVFWWGKSIAPTDANYWSEVSFNGGPTASWRATTVAVNSFKPNAWGLYQVHGNAIEWVADCWHPDYVGAPTDESAWDGGAGKACAQRTTRGGSWGNAPDFLRSAHRGPYFADRGNIFISFRVARSVP